MQTDFLFTLYEVFFSDDEAVQQFGSAEEVKTVFDYFFKCFQEHFGKEHPFVPQLDFVEMIQKLPVIENEFGQSWEMSPEDYNALIDAYFNTEYKSNYLIYHFFSGRIRCFLCKKVFGG